MRWLVSRGWHGWVLLLALVVAFDVAAAAFGGESMTDAARRWFNHGAGRWVVLAVIVYIAVHLTVMPYRHDPLDRAFDWVQKKVHPEPNWDEKARDEPTEKARP